jgi:hypothetical protein
LVLEDLGRGAEASRLRRERIEAGTRNVTIFQAEARFLREAGKSAEALEILDRAVQLGVADDYMLRLRASVLEDVGSDK